MAALKAREKCWGDEKPSELPIAADFVGRRLDVPDDLRVQVHMVDRDKVDGVFLMKESK